jgi:hypothetical protein
VTRSSTEAIKFAQAQIANPSQNWYRLCQTFVRTCFGIGPGAWSAGAAWDAAKYKHPVTSGRSVPAGVPVFWETSSDADHVAISIGGGKCISTDIARPGKVDGAWNDGVTRRWNCTLTGGTEDLNGVRIATGTSADGTNIPLPSSGSTGGGAGGSVVESPSTVSSALLNAYNWVPEPDPTSEILTGPRALMNDSPLLQTVAMLCKASMRSFMAAPNGDFIAWFPDYFGTYGLAAKMKIRDIELATDGFTITWSDERLVTHQYTAGSSTGYSSGSSPTMAGAAVDIVRMSQTLGIATVEFPELMEALFNIDKKDPRAANFLDAGTILQRFGARVDYQPMGQITGPQAEFWYACQLFQQNWAQQFSANVQLTFMPELWPGMLIELETFGFQAYVERVTHSFSFADGGGFDTSVDIIAPSATKGGLYALPRANGQMSTTPKAKPKPKKKKKPKPKSDPRHKRGEAL